MWEPEEDEDVEQGADARDEENVAEMEERAKEDA